MKLREILREGRARLNEAGVPSADFDARELLLEAFGISASDYIMLSELSPEEAFPADYTHKPDTFNEYIEKRACRVPLQYITGKAWFMGFPFKVTEATLCPRPDTETLTEAVIKDFSGKDPFLLDMCTGTGCIGISLKKILGLRRVFLSDISADALSIARENAQKLCPGEDIEIFESDLFEAFSAYTGDRRFDAVTVNPPYIKEAVIDTLMPEVRDYEPRLALSGGDDGLSFYRRIAEEAPLYTKSLYLETGYDQGEEVYGLLLKAGFKDIKILKDAGSNDRVVKGIYADN